MRATLAQNDKRCGLCFDVMLHEREPEPLSGTYFGNLDLKCPMSVARNPRLRVIESTS